MTPLQQHMMTALQRSGKSARPPQTSVREVRLLAQFSRPSPALISAQALPHYVLHRKTLDRLAPRSLRLCSSAIRFFSRHVLGRAWKTRDLMRAASAPRLPARLSLEAGRRLLQASTPVPTRVSCPTVSSCGRRLHEALSLQGSASASPRSMLPVHRGQGAKNRSVPLPHDPLARLRLSWNTPRHPTWLLPACGREHQQRATARAPLCRSSVQGACRTATQRAGSIKRDVGGQTLRHASATHRRAAGVTRRAMQRSMGPAPLDTPMRSRPLTPKGHDDAYQRREARRHGCQV